MILCVEFHQTSSDRPVSADVSLSQPAERQFVYDAAAGAVVRLAKDKYGCGTLHRCLEAGDDSQKLQLAMAVGRNARPMATDAHGNYILQNVMAMDRLQPKEAAVESLSGSFVALAKHKFGSNVVEKCVSAGEWALQAVMCEIFLVKNGVEELLGDRYGNFVMQAIIKKCKVDGELLHSLRSRITDYERVHAGWSESLVGVRILQKLNKRLRSARALELREAAANEQEQQVAQLLDDGEGEPEPEPEPPLKWQTEAGWQQMRDQSAAFTAQMEHWDGGSSGGGGRGGGQHQHGRSGINGREHGAGPGRRQRTPAQQQKQKERQQARMQDQHAQRAQRQHDQYAHAQQQQQHFQPTQQQQGGPPQMNPQQQQQQQQQPPPPPRQAPMDRSGGGGDTSARGGPPNRNGGNGNGNGNGNGRIDRGGSDRARDRSDRGDRDRGGVQLGDRLAQARGIEMTQPTRRTTTPPSANPKDNGRPDIANIAATSDPRAGSPQEEPVSPTNLQTSLMPEVAAPLLQQPMIESLLDDDEEQPPQDLAFERLMKEMVRPLQHAPLASLVLPTDGTWSWTNACVCLCVQGWNGEGEMDDDDEEGGLTEEEIKQAKLLTAAANRRAAANPFAQNPSVTAKTATAESVADPLAGAVAAVVARGKSQDDEDSDSSDSDDDAY